MGNPELPSVDRISQVRRQPPDISKEPAFHVTAVQGIPYNEDMEKERKLELIQRSLGIRHKLKVHESVKIPDTHEEVAVMMLAKWELEDELHAIEQILSEVRHESVDVKRAQIEKNLPLVKKTKKK